MTQSYFFSIFHDTIPTIPYYAYIVKTEKIKNRMRESTERKKCSKLNFCIFFSESFNIILSIKLQRHKMLFYSFWFSLLTAELKPEITFPHSVNSEVDSNL